MNEIFDRLLIRVLLVGIVLAVVATYKAAHFIFYPTMRGQVRKRFYPGENPADTLHLFSRLIGFAVVVSSLGFDEEKGIMLSLFHLLVWGTLTSALYLLSLYLVESIVLHDFEYKDEVLKRHNTAYAIVCAAHALAIAHVTRVVVDQAENSLVILFVLWMLAMVVMGFGAKLFGVLSRMNFTRLITQKNPSIALSYLGFTLGLSWLVAESFSQEHFDITMYCIQVVLKILLCLVVFPLFKMGLHALFKVHMGGANGGSHEPDMQNWGYGAYEGAQYLSAAVLTSMIVNHIQFGTIYPFF